jgi:hypothetical protein
LEAERVRALLQAENLEKKRAADAEKAKLLADQRAAKALEENYEYAQLYWGEALNKGTYSTVVQD